MARHETDDSGLGNFKKRDLASMVALVGPILMVFALIGKHYVDGYRLNKLEAGYEQMARDSAAQRDRLYTLETIAIKEPRFDRLERRIDQCCSNNRNARRWNAD